MRKIIYCGPEGQNMDIFINGNGDLSIFIEDTHNGMSEYTTLDKQDVLSLIKDLQDVVKDMN